LLTTAVYCVAAGHICHSLHSWWVQTLRLPGICWHSRFHVHYGIWCDWEI